MQEKNLGDLGFDDELLDITQKAQSMKKKLINWPLLKSKPPAL